MLPGLRQFVTDALQQLACVVEATQMGHDHRAARQGIEGGGTTVDARVVAQGLFVASVLLGELPRQPEAEVLLFNALRAQLLVGTVRPLLAEGTWVLSDRSRLSTLAYQGHGHGVDLAWTRDICNATVALQPADLEVVLSLDEAEATRRRADRGVTDRFEAMDDAFHRRVTAGYLTEARALGVPVVDAAGTEAEVTDRLWSHLEPLLG